MADSESDWALEEHLATKELIAETQDAKAFFEKAAPRSRPLADRALRSLAAAGIALCAAGILAEQSWAAYTGLALLALAAARVIALLQVLYPIRQLNEPPTEVPTVDVPGHGTVHRGYTDVPQEGGSDRLFLWL